MAKMEYTWPAESVDAVGIRIRDGNITIRETDADEVRLESNGSEKDTAKLNVDQLGCWLWISTPTSGKDIQLTLLLPKQKPWLIDLHARNANFKAENIKTRLNLILAKGEVYLNDCRGAFSLASGNANVSLKRVNEEEVPEMPPLPEDERKKRRKSSGIYTSGIYMYTGWGKDDWSQWGLDLSEKTVKGFLGQRGGVGQSQGINLKAAKSDFEIEDMDIKNCNIRAAKSTVRIKAGCVAKLDLSIIKGNIEIDSSIPGDDWKIKTNSGNISLSLPSDINARIDAATRHGDIKSVTPLVRVTRQGPEPWHGRRMVGIVGLAPQKKERIPELHLSVLNGDIIIETKTAETLSDGETEVTESPSSSTPLSTVDSYKTQMAVLEALSEKRITVKEAERLLDSLESKEKIT